MEEAAKKFLRTRAATRSELVEQRSNNMNKSNEIYGRQRRREDKTQVKQYTMGKHTKGKKKTKFVRVFYLSNTLPSQTGSSIDIMEEVDI